MSDDDEQPSPPRGPAHEAARILTEWAAAEKPCVARDRGYDSDEEYDRRQTRAEGDVRPRVRAAGRVRGQLRALKMLGARITATAPRLRALLEGILASDARRLYLHDLYQRLSDATSLSRAPDQLRALLAAHPWMRDRVQPATWSDHTLDVRDAVEVQVEVADASEFEREHFAAHLPAWRAWLAEQPARSQPRVPRKHNLLLPHGVHGSYAVEQLVAAWAERPDVPAAPPPAWPAAAEGQGQGQGQGQWQGRHRRRPAVDVDGPDTTVNPEEALIRLTNAAAAGCENRAERVCVCSFSRESYMSLSKAAPELAMVKRLLPRLPALVVEAEGMQAWARAMRRRLDAAVLAALREGGKAAIVCDALETWRRAGAVAPVDPEWRATPRREANDKVRQHYAALTVPRVLDAVCEAVGGGTILGVNTTLLVWDPRDKVRDASLPEPAPDAVAAYEAALSDATAAMRATLATVHAAMVAAGVLGAAAAPTEPVLSNGAVGFDEVEGSACAPLRAALLATIPPATIDAHAAAAFKEYRAGPDARLWGPEAPGSSREGSEAGSEAGSEPGSEAGSEASSEAAEAGGAV